MKLPSLIRAGAFAAALTTQTAWADYEEKAYFPITSELLMNKILESLDNLPIGIPFQQPICGVPTVLKYCRIPLTANLTFGITETYSDETTVPGFMRGDPGNVYDVFATLKISPTDQDGAMFDTLCAAIISSMRPKLLPENALQLHVKALNKAINRSGKTGEGIWIDQNGAPLVESANKSSVTCRITTQPESYEISG